MCGFQHGGWKCLYYAETDPCEPFQYEDAVIGIGVVIFRIKIPTTEIRRYPSTLALGYGQTSNISGTLADYKIADHSDVVGASPVGAAALKPHLHSRLNTCSMNWAKSNYKTRRETFKFGDWFRLISNIWCFNNARDISPNDMVKSVGT